MKITNKLNLPDSFINSIERRQPEPLKYSVTELLMPTREIVLFRRYFNEIEEDVSDTIPALFGSAVHHILEINNKVKEQVEVKLEAFVCGVCIVGRCDILTENSIEDYKTCSVSKVMKQDFEDYRKQGLMYAYLNFKKTGKIVRKLKFYCLMKDWSKIKSMTSSNYPSSPVYVWEYDISDSDYDYIYEFIADKLKDIHDYEFKSPESLCSDEDRWYSGTKYAVYKNVGSKRADYIADTEEDAHNYISNKCNGAGQIEVRRGEYVKCNYYCSVSKFCIRKD